MMNKPEIQSFQKEADRSQVETLIEELIQDQKDKLLKLGRRLIPGLTSDDILQPNDFPDLENHPHFRYEEGLLAGMQTVQTALRAFRKRED